MSTIWVPEGTGVSAADILDDVNGRLDNDREPKSAEFPGDGLAEILHMPDRGICGDEYAPIIYTLLDSTPTTLTEGRDYTIDYQSGFIYLLTDHVDVGETLYVDYSTRYWSDQLLWRLLNNGLSYIWPRFYAVNELEPTADSYGDYPLTDPAGRVISAVIDVEDVASDKITHYSPVRDYRVVRGSGESAVLRLYHTPSGTLTVHCAVRPLPFTTPATLLSDIGLPERVREPLTLYVCWQAVTQKMPQRARWDNVTAANQEGKTTFRDHTSMVQIFKMLLDAELSVNHMTSWTRRGL